MSEINEIIGKLGNIEGKIDGINERLDRLNGSVARHEQVIKDICVDQAVMKESVKEVPDIEKALNKIKLHNAKVAGGAIAIFWLINLVINNYSKFVH